MGALSRARERPEAGDVSVAMNDFRDSTDAPSPTDPASFVADRARIMGFDRSAEAGRGLAARPDGPAAVHGDRFR
ncbi:hypothetical protein KIK06_25665 [Nocardiopsis sp. EMB25]|uniref:hypothetical protein n=1 Tax=Nocardiopsis sp. EMB25 TaxID=2835867 RepID=UPI0022843363|nr:hypothetical protein [Nocardiopsis sp. EMB25]MCY9787274.1 hypothetical protein [Nocardiopsis sp. EMB25]